ncbi:MAG: polyprenyl synthetase family protein [Patescibacteria group bacterium]|nr:polyprenyl synthetase family protein [Patescibacteria group bacterium]
MNNLLEELKEKGELVDNYLLGFKKLESLKPSYLRDGFEHYIRQGGKRLRPALVLWACELVGGDIQKALPAAAAIELSHTWTLVHDDIIDKDDLRRGAPSMHAYYKEYFEGKYPGQDVDHLAKSFAMLVGDTQQSLATSMLNQVGVAPDIKKWLIDDLTTSWLPEVLQGEVLDVEFAWRNLSELSEEEIIEMLSLKTASTFVWSVRAGGVVGLNKIDLDNSVIKALETIALQAGLAFQLHDDVLGILGSEKDLGKPIGSDIREGKRTIISVHAYKNANLEDCKVLDEVLGNENASEGEVGKVKEIFIKLGSIEYVKKLIKEASKKALSEFDNLPEHKTKGYFKDWVDFIGNRDF